MTLEGSIDDLNAALATLNFTPDSGFTGEASLDILSSDGEFSDMDTIAIVVNAPPAPDPPIILDGGDPQPIDIILNPEFISEEICALVNDPPDFPTVNVTDTSIIGDDGVDTVTGMDIGETFSTAGGNDWVIALAGNDNLNGGDGDDTLSGNQGRDVIDGGSGNDYILAGKGDDGVRGGEGNDAIAGNIGNDILEGNDGDDLIFGNTGDDYIDGGLGEDTIHGGMDNDGIVGGEGNDVILGEYGNDCLHGDEGEDLLAGNKGTDVLHGGQGNDLLAGGMDDDTLVGGNGHDLLFGDKGNDLLIGGLGRDIFVLRPGDGTDTIAEFFNGADAIALPDGLTFADLTIETLNSNRVAIHFGEETLAILNDIPNGGAAGIDTEDFLPLR